MREKTKQDRTNYGIQANTVQADAIAVGPHAHATSHTSAEDGVMLQAAMAELRAAIAGLALHPEGRQAIEIDLGVLESEVATTKPNRRRTGSLLQSIADKVRVVQGGLHDTAELAGVLSKLGELLRVPLGF